LCQLQNHSTKAQHLHDTTVTPLNNTRHGDNTRYMGIYRYM